ncbi:MAG TPA: MBOAT family protein [Verrucomicrobiae bacterium]|nr:MBOAT family protein [Verrucomicrobiae bacterium]
MNRIIDVSLARSRAGRVAARWIAALTPVLCCAVAARDLPTWAYMWLLAASMFAGAKWIVAADYFGSGNANPWRLAAFLFLWPGLNAEKFLFRTAMTPTLGEWFAATGKTVFGAVILWGGLRLIPASHPVLLGWGGLVGTAFLLHFGLFHLLSIAWRAAGFDAARIMSNPIRATSLAGFWGGRWNKAFNDLMGPHVFRPLAQSVGTVAATIGVFLFSGLLHEMVISLPARGGFGLPTIYFGLQAAGLFFERSRRGRRLGLGRGWRGWLFTVTVAALPAYWLFHPIFIRNVILPMLRAIGAI